jgi:hypothetical protein
METPQVKLSFANTVEQFDTGDGGSCAIEVLEAKQFGLRHQDGNVLLRWLSPALANFCGALQGITASPMLLSMMSWTSVESPSSSFYGVSTRFSRAS